MLQLRQGNEYPILECDHHVVEVYEVRRYGILPDGVATMMRMTEAEFTPLLALSISMQVEADESYTAEGSTAYAVQSIAASNLVIIELMQRLAEKKGEKDEWQK
jgi:hypothetical protein